LSSPIKNWNKEERPREKLLQKGSAALTNAELLAILISTGSGKKSALDLARDIMALAFDQIHRLGRLSVQELKAVKGIGEAKAITIAAALELGRRRQLNEGLEQKKILSSKDSFEVLSPLLRDKSSESLVILFLNQSCKLIKYDILSEGGLTSTIVDVRVILKQALILQSNNLIMAHNHPSGNLKPSQADKDITTKLKDSAKLMDINLLDHLIIGGNEYFSMADEGLI